jgi:hypothetical protein
VRSRKRPHTSGFVSDDSATGKDTTKFLACFTIYFKYFVFVSVSYSKVCSSFPLHARDCSIPVPITHYGFCGWASYIMPFWTFLTHKHLTWCAVINGRILAAWTCSRCFSFLLNRHNFQHILDEITAWQFSNILVWFESELWATCRTWKCLHVLVSTTKTLNILS